MSAFLTQMATDGKLTLKNIFLWITLGFLVLIVILVNFFLPKEVTTEPIVVAHYGLDLIDQREAGSIVELEEMVRQDDRLVGVYKEQGELVVLVNNLSEKQAATALSTVLDAESNPSVQYSHTSQIIEPAPFNKRMVPMMISLEAVMTGILLVGVMILTEKERRITRAYRISPSGTLSYVLSKTVLFSLVGMVYSFLIAVFTVGFQFHIGPFLLLSFLVSALFTLMGIAVSVFLQSISTWLMLMAFLIGTNTLVLFAYIFPAISMNFMKVLPAYTMIFAYERTMFGPAGFSGNGFEILTIWTLGLFALSLICVKFRLLRPHKGE